MNQNFSETGGEVGNDSHYRLIVPENSTPTYIHIHAMGAATDFTHEDVYYILDGDRNKDTAYLLLDDADGQAALNASDGYAKLVEDLSKQYNIPVSNISLAAFSRGSNVGLATYAKLVEDGYDVPYYVHMSANSTNLAVSCYKRVAEVYKNSSNPPPFIYVNDSSNNADKNLTNALAYWPGDVIELKDFKDNEKDINYAGSHSCDYQYILNNLTGFLNGTSDLENFDGYQYVKVYTLDDSGNRVEKTFASQEEFNAYIKAYRDTYGADLSSLTTSYAPINFSAQEIGSELVQSDRQELLTYLNDIRKNLTLEVSVRSYNSTTAIPNSESDAVQQFFEGTQRLFQVIEADTEFILSAAISLEDLDKLLAEKAGGLEEPKTLGETVTGFVKSIGEFPGFMLGGMPFTSKITNIFSQIMGGTDNIFAAGTTSETGTSSSTETTETETASNAETSSESKTKQIITPMRTPLDPLDPSTFANPPILPYVTKDNSTKEIDTIPPRLMPIDPLDPLN